MEREIKEKAICLKNSDSGEFDRFIWLFSIERGVFKAKIRGVKKPKAKLSFASFPLCLGEYLLVKTGNNYTVTNCNYIDNFAGLTSDLNLYYAGLGVLDVDSKVVKENQIASNIFVATIKTLSALCYDKVNIFAVLVKFCFEVLASIGFGVSFDVDIDKTKNIYFDFYAGRFSNYASEDSAKISVNDFENLQEIWGRDIENFEDVISSKNMFRMILSYFEFKTEEEFSVFQMFSK